jgi:EmrB/QacA subfamily drug resistance transporter
MRSTFMHLPRLDLSQSRHYKWWAFLAIAVGTFTSVADFGSLIVALPTISAHFGTDLPTTQWVLVGYSLTISALLLPMGRLSDIIGRRRVYVIGFGIFIVGGLLASTAQDIRILILFKILMGIGGSMTQGTGMAMAVTAFPDNERGQALGSSITVVGAGNILGPVLGGLIIGALGWRWIFYTSVILSVVSISAVMIVLDGKRFSRRGGGSVAFDWPGAALSSGILLSFLLVMTNGPRVGWTNPPVMIGIALVIAFIGIFVWWEKRIPAPLMDLGLFKSRFVSMAVAAQFLSFAANSSVRFLIPFYLQAVQGYSPQQVGLIIVPSAIAMIVAGPISGRLSDKYGLRRFTVGGLIMSTTGLLILSAVTETTPLAFIVLALIMQMSGNGTFYPPNNASILGAVEEGKYGVMSSFVNLVRNAGNITGIAIGTAIVTAVMASMGFQPSLAAVTDVGSEGVIDSFVSGLRVAYRIMAGVMVISMVLSFIRGGGSASATTSDNDSPEPLPAKQS